MEISNSLVIEEQRPQDSNYISENPHFVISALTRYTNWDFIGLVCEYGIEYEERKDPSIFVKFALPASTVAKVLPNLKSHEISDLRSSLPEKAIIILANGTGISVDDLSWRDLSGLFEKLKRVIDKEIEENPDAFASLFQRWEIKP
mgnify:CR=1 FL=1